MSENKASVEKKQGIIERFLFHCKRGFYIGVDTILPSMILGYVIIAFLDLTGLSDLLGIIFEPVMGLFGLPGEAVTVLISAFFAKASGAGAAAALYNAGTITAAQAAVCLMPSMLMGTLVGHFVRVVLVAGTNAKHRLWMIGVALMDAAIGMWLMRLFLVVTGQW